MAVFESKTEWFGFHFPTEGLTKTIFPLILKCVGIDRREGLYTVFGCHTGNNGNSNDKTRPFVRSVTELL